MWVVNYDKPHAEEFKLEADLIAEPQTRPLSQRTLGPQDVGRLLDGFPIDVEGAWSSHIPRESGTF